MTGKSLTIEAAKQKLLQLQKESARARKIKLANFYNLLHSNRIARELVWEILDLTGFNSVHHTADNSIFLAEGRRHVGMEVINMLNEMDPMLYPTMILERGKNARPDTRTDDTSTDDTDDTPADEPTI